MNGTLSVSGQEFILKAISDKINSNGGVYVGLMTNYITPLNTYQTPSGAGIKELDSNTCAGYHRILCENWTYVATPTPHLTGSGLPFVIEEGSWNDVYGYFVSYNNASSGVLWSELLPPDKGGVITSGNYLILTPRYYQY
jgi:hypothetical protein